MKKPMTRRELLKLGVAVGAVAGFPMAGARVLRADEGHEHGHDEEGHGIGLIIGEHEGHMGFHPNHLELHRGEEYHVHITSIKGNHQLIFPFLVDPVTVEEDKITHIHLDLTDAEVGEYAISMVNMDVTATLHVGPPCPEE